MNRRQRRSVILTLCTALVLSILSAPPARAHTGFYPFTWVTEYRTCFLLLCKWHTRDMEWWATGSGWTTTNQNRIKNAQAQWNAVPTKKHLHLRYNGVKSLSANPCQNGYNNNGHRFARLNQNWLGVTTYCIEANRSKLWSVMLTYNTRYPWYNGTGKPSRTRYDLWSVMVHELGHAAGFSPHFTDTRICPTPWSNTSRQTMCSGLSPGAIYKRTLGTHDKHALQRAYR